MHCKHSRKADIRSRVFSPKICHILTNIYAIIASLRAWFFALNRFRFYVIRFKAIANALHHLSNAANAPARRGGDARAPQPKN